MRRIEAILIDIKSKVGRPPDISDRMFIEAVLYVARTGIPWRDLPEFFANFSAIYNRLRRWKRNGTWQQLWERLETDGISFNDWHGLVTKAQGWQVDMCYLLQRNANGVFEFAPFSEGGNAVWTASNVKPVDDTWYHVAGVYTSIEALIYVDGLLSAKQAFALGIADTNAPVVIGTNYPTAIQPVKGIIDEVAIFSVAFSEEDINTIMTEGLEAAVGIKVVEPSGKLALTWGEVRALNDK
ncbi:transposase [bacterium]|nr:transposase [bacterium]